MNSLFDFIVEPYGDRYNNEVKVGDKSLIINTKIESYKSVNNIGKVIKSHAGDRERILDELAKLPITELQEEKVNVYLCKQAIERKKDIERESKATYVNADKILGALKGLSKEKNFRYKQKKEYNIRNGIKPWEKNGR